MHRPDHDSAVAVRPATAAAGTPGWFQDGNAAEGIRGTVVQSDFLNDLLANCLAVCAAGGVSPVKGDDNNLRDAILAMIAAGTVPTGAVLHFCSTTAPTGWIKANGALLSRTTYADLFAAIGTTFGAGDGVTTFAIPDIRGEFVRGLDDGRGIDAGRALGTRQKGSLQTYDPEATAFDPVGLRLPSGQTIEAAFGLDGLAGDTYAADNARYVAGGTGTSISNAAGVVRPRNIALLACIKY